MRDSKLFLHENTAPDAASGVVDLGGSTPGIDRVLMYSLTVSTDAVITAPATVTLSGADTAAGAQAAQAVLTIPANVKPGGVILSTAVPANMSRYVTSAIAGITGGTATDGFDYGLSFGPAATKPFVG